MWLLMNVIFVISLRSQFKWKLHEIPRFLCFYFLTVGLLSNHLIKLYLIDMFDSSRSWETRSDLNNFWLYQSWLVIVNENDTSYLGIWSQIVYILEINSLLHYFVCTWTVREGSTIFRFEGKSMQKKDSFEN